MSTPSNIVMQKGDGAIKRGNIPDWINSFLQMQFFNRCQIHHVQKNEMNRYCITCNASACRYCIKNGAHGDNHDVLTIYRHVYQNVVPLDEMENHINCRRIQPYKCNKKWVVSTTPLPHTGSGLLIEGDGACHVCRRKLTEPGRFHYCCIACKVQKSSGISVINSPTPVTSTAKIEEDEPAAKRQKRRRKGVPCRAPFF